MRVFVLLWNFKCRSQVERDSPNLAADERVKHLYWEYFSSVHWYACLHVLHDSYSCSGRLGLRAETGPLIKEGESGNATQPSSPYGPTTPELVTGLLCNRCQKRKICTSGTRTHFMYCTRAVRSERLEKCCSDYTLSLPCWFQSR